MEEKLNNSLENMIANHLNKSNIHPLESDNTIEKLTFNEWQNIEFVKIGNHTNINQKTFKLLSELKNLKIVDFNCLKSTYDLHEIDYDLFTINKVQVKLNDELIYSNFKMNQYKKPELLENIKKQIKEAQDKLEFLILKKDELFGIEFK